MPKKITNKITGAGTSEDPAIVLLNGEERPFVVSIGAMIQFERASGMPYDRFWQKVVGGIFVRGEDGHLATDEDGSFVVNSEGVSLTEIYMLLLPFFTYGAKRCKVPLPDDFDVELLADWIDNDFEIIQKLNEIISRHMAPAAGSNDEKNAPSPAPAKAPGLKPTPKARKIRK